MYSVNSISRQIFIGRKGETGTRSVQFDVSAWMQINGSLTVGIVAIRPGETEAYVPIDVTAANGVLTWVPDAVDTAIPGTGVMLIRGTDSDGNVIKSAQTTYVVESAFDDDGYTPTEPEESWLSHAEAVLAGMVESIGNTADQAVDDIEAAAAQAVSDMSDAAQTAVEGAVQEVLDTAVGTVEDWIEENLSQETGYVIDTSLTTAGAAADAKATGIEIRSGGFKPYTITTWTKGLVNAGNQWITTNDNGATAGPISAERIIYGDGCRAVMRMWKNGTYLGKCKNDGTIDKNSGNWRYFTGEVDAAALMETFEADSYDFSLIPTDSTTITTETVAAYGAAHCDVMTRRFADVSVEGEVEWLNDTVVYDHSVAVNDRYVLSDTSKVTINPVPAGETILIRTINGENLSADVIVYWTKPDGTGGNNVTVKSGTNSRELRSTSDIIGSLKPSSTPSTPMEAIHLAPKKIETRLGVLEDQMVYDHGVTVNDRYVLKNADIIRINTVPAGDTILVRTINGDNLSGNVIVYMSQPDGTSAGNRTISSGTNSLEIVNSNNVGSIQLSTTPSTPMEAVHITPGTLQTRMDIAEAGIDGLNGALFVPYTVATWTKGIVNAVNQWITTNDNGATAGPISAERIIYGDGCRAVMRMWKNGTYLGKCKDDGTLDKNSGNWRYFTGEVDAAALMETFEADSYDFSLIPTDSTTITTETVATYGNAHCDAYINHYVERAEVEAVADAAALAQNTADIADAATANVRVINHRGFNTVAPENTLPAFEMSARRGFKYVETDVLFTCPDAENELGVPVLLHDATINRTARNPDGTSLSSTVYIADITYEEALEYVYCDNKYSAYPTVKLPTFEEFIKLCKRLGLHPYIELKNEKTYSQDEIDLLLSIISANGMRKHVSFISYDSNALTLVKNRWDWVELGMHVSGGTIADYEALMTGKNEVFATHDKSTAIPDIIEAGIPACPYTVDTVSQLQALDPYYSYVLTNVLTLREIEENMFDEGESV